jgi:hypothetical protein
MPGLFHLSALLVSISNVHAWLPQGFRQVSIALPGCFPSAMVLCVLQKTMAIDNAL